LASHPSTDCANVNFVSGTNSGFAFTQSKQHHCRKISGPHELGIDWSANLLNSRFARQFASAIIADHVPQKAQGQAQDYQAGP